MARYLDVMRQRPYSEEEYLKDAWNEIVDEHNWYAVIDNSKGFIYSNIKVVKAGVTKPSESDFNAKVKELKDAYAAAQYKGNLDKTSDFYTTNKAVKDKYSK